MIEKIENELGNQLVLPQGQGRSQSVAAVAIAPENEEPALIRNRKGHPRRVQSRIEAPPEQVPAIPVCRRGRPKRAAAADMIQDVNPVVESVAAPVRRRGRPREIVADLEQKVYQADADDGIH